MAYNTYYFFRQRNELDLYKKYGYSQMYGEWNRKWGIEDMDGSFRLMIRYRGKYWKDLQEFLEIWGDYVDYLIVPIGKYDEKNEKMYAYINDEKDLELAKDIKPSRVALSTNAITKGYRRMLNKIGVKDYILYRYESRGDNVRARINSYILDNSIAKRLLVLNGGWFEVRHYKEYGMIDFKKNVNGDDVDFDFEDLKSGKFLFILEHNIYVYMKYYIKGEKKNKKEWEIIYEKLEKEGRLPEWVNEKDMRGNKKAIYLASRYNRLRHGLYAKSLKNEAYICDTCPIKDTCPFYEKGSVCAFTTIWKDMGETRNVEWILKHMEDVISDEMARYFRAVYIEGQSGDVANISITKLGDTLMKHLEIYSRLLTGKGDVSVDMKMEVSLDKALEEVRKMYGEELANKIEEKIKDESE